MKFVTASLLKWLDRIVLGWVFVLAAAAPHSIAATQIAWGTGLFLWAIRLLLSFPRRPVLFRSPLDYPLLTFFALTVLSSFLSYDPVTSIGKLRAASLFTIIYLISQNVRSSRTAKALVALLLVSCMVNVVYTIGERALGRGVKVQGMTDASPLRRAGLTETDTLLEVDGLRLRNIEELERNLNADAAAAHQGAPAHIKIYRYEAYIVVNVARGEMLSGDTAAARLGVATWSRGRDWRASGFYDHYTTYAEALQLIASLVFGLLIACRRKFSTPGVLLSIALAGMSIALFLTVTRASWLSFLLSITTITLMSRNRRVLLLMALAAALVIPAGLYLLQQKRHVGFFDRHDASITWRQTIWHEGFDLLISRPRHMLVGVGMDSIKRYWQQWGLFDNGRLPMGHMHSTPLELALERGIPALIAWASLVFLYARMLFLLLWRRTRITDWAERGILLGALGGLVGFISSGMVHYNLGDSEVAMIFYFIIGITLVLEREARTKEIKDFDAKDDQRLIRNSG